MKKRVLFLFCMMILAAAVFCGCEGNALPEEEGEAIGELKERLKNVKALMDSLKVSALDAMEILKFSPEEQQKLLPLL